MIHSADNNHLTVPQCFLFDPNLSGSQKIMCGLIHKYEAAIGHCALTNSVFATAAGLTKNAAAQNIKRLLEQGVVEVLNSREGWIRRLRLARDYVADGEEWAFYRRPSSYQFDPATAHYIDTLDGYQARRLV